MSEDDQRAPTTGRSWLDRLGQVLFSEPRDQAELAVVLRDASERGLLDSEALGMIEGVLGVSEMQVRDVMIPRAQMVVLEDDWSLERVVQVVVASGHSRLPVVGENRDQVLGTLLAKDLLRYIVQAGDQPFELKELLRPAKFIPESKRLHPLLREFRTTRLHMAIVVDEYGGVSGLVTIEDVLEEIVGEIDDEHDIEDHTFIKDQGNGQYLVNALTPIQMFNDTFGASFSDEEFDTMGGVVINEFGRLPRKGEQVEIAGFCFSVVRADNRRIHLLQLQR